MLRCLRSSLPGMLKSCQGVAGSWPWQKTLHTAQPTIAGSSRFSAEEAFSVGGSSDICLTTASGTVSIAQSRVGWIGIPARCGAGDRDSRYP